jgi:riboflavin biosynthesis pyrimidine reductase
LSEEPLRLEVLYEAPGLPVQRLPAVLEERYGGGLGFSAPVLYGNLVSTVDGITALDGETPPSVVAAGSTADRFVMGLLRAFAGAVVIGASTLRAEPRHLWTAGKVHPASADGFAALRASLGLATDPRLVVVSASGAVDPVPPLEHGALVLTSTAGAERLRGSLPAASTLRAIGDGPALDGESIVAAIRDEGHGTILTEGGAMLIGTLLGAGALDELFLTVSPRLAGARTAAGRRGVVEGVAFGPRELVAGRLLSVRRHDSHVFLRYAVGGSDSTTGTS